MRVGNERAQLTTLLYYGAVLLLVYLVFRIFEPFLVPLGWAVVLAVCAYPLQEWLKRRWGRTSAAAASTLGVALVLVIPALVLLGGFVRQGLEAARAIEQAHGSATAPFIVQIDRVTAWLQHYIPSMKSVDPVQVAQQGTEWLAQFLAARAGTLAKNAALFLLHLIIMLFALFYLFRDADDIVDGARRLLPFDEPQRTEMLSRARELISASVTASLVISAVQGVIGGISFALVGLPAPIFWAVVMAFFALLPMVGSWIIWVPAALWLFTQGHIGGGVTLAIACGLVAGSIDHFVRPILLSGRARMSPLLVLISVLGGISVFGMLGIVLGPIVVATAAGILGAYTADYKGREVVGTRPASMVESGPGRT
jgi:predicted PurR-regulated permease PerM